MAILEQIKEMKNQGLSDEDIINQLYEKGVSPKEINDAMNQLQIKKAVVGEEENTAYPSQENYVPRNPSTEEVYGQQYSSQPQEYYQQGGYNDYQSQGIDTDMVIEISEQVFSEKIKEVQKKVDSINEFKTIAETKIENIADRLKKIENIIDKLQISIIEKIGSYGQNINSIKKEMSMMQDSFGKVIKQAVKGSKSSKK